MLLAAWYKRALKESLLGKVYANRAKVKGVDLNNPATNEEIYQQYLKAFKKGVFNYIKEDVDRLTKEQMPRKYFSGGTTGFTQDPAMSYDQLVTHVSTLSADAASIAQGSLYGIDRALVTVTQDSAMKVALKDEISLNQDTWSFGIKAWVEEMSDKYPNLKTELSDFQSQNSFKNILITFMLLGNAISKMTNSSQVIDEVIENFFERLSYKATIEKFLRSAFKQLAKNARKMTFLLRIYRDGKMMALLCKKY